MSLKSEGLNAGDVSVLCAGVAHLGSLDLMFLSACRHLSPSHAGQDSISSQMVTDCRQGCDSPAPSGGLLPSLGTVAVLPEDLGLFLQVSLRLSQHWRSP